MKKIILLLFTIALFSNTYSQKAITKYYDYKWNPCTKEKASYYRIITYDSKGKPLGIVRDYYMSGDLQWEGRILSENIISKDEILDGKCIWYFQDGYINQVGNYKNGKLNGKFLDFYYNYHSHSLRLDCNYKDGKKDGLYKKYDEDGNLILITTYKADSIHGKFIEYHSNGKLKTQCNYINGKIEGERIYYYNDGEYHISNYIHGIRQGEFKRYENNELVSISNFKNDTVNGIQLDNFFNNAWDTTIYKNGIRQEIDTILNFKKTILVDSIKREITVENGDTISDISYVNGLKQGYVIYYDSYYPRENYKNIMHYSKGKYDGECKTYYPNGVLAFKKIYRYDTLKESVSYNEIGIETSKLLYKTYNTYTSKRIEGYECEFYSTGICKNKKEYPKEHFILETSYYPNGKIYSEEKYPSTDSSFTKFYDINGNLMYSQQKFDCNKNDECKYKTTFYDINNKIIATLIDTRSYQRKWNLDYSLIPFKFRESEQMKGNYYECEKEETEEKLPVILFKITKDSLFGVYTKEGKEILPCNNTYISDIQNGCMVYATQNYYSVVDIFGKQSPFKAAYIQSYLPEGFIIYSNARNDKSINQKFGMVDYSGKTIIPCIYDWISEDIQMGVIWVKNNGKYGAFNTQGKQLFSTVYTYEPKVLEINKFNEFEFDLNGDSPDYNIKTVNSYFAHPQFTKEGIAVIMKDGKYGLVSIEGKTVLNCVYDSIITCNYFRTNFKSSSIIALVCQNSKWGAIDKNGKYIIPLSYSDVMPIIYYKGEEKNYAIYTVQLLVKSGNYWGIVSDKNEILIPFSYEYGYVDFKRNENPRIYLIKDSIPYSIDAYTLHSNCNENTILQNKVKDDLHLYSTFLKKYQYEPKWYNYKPSSYKQNTFSIYLNSNGKIIVPPIYYCDIDNYLGLRFKNQHISKFKTIDGKSLYLGKNDKVLFNLESGYEIQTIKGTYAGVFNKNSKWGIYDVIQKRLLVDTLYDAIYKFNDTDSVFWVRKFSGDFNIDTIKVNPFVGGWGLVTIGNKKVLDCKYDLPFSFIGNNAKIMLHDKFGVVNNFGKIILAIEYQKIEILSNGYILFGNETWGLADNNGNVLFKPQWINVTPYIKENLLFWSNTGIGVIDKSGKIVKTIANSDLQNSTISLMQYFDADLFDFETYPNMKHMPTSILNIYLISTLKNESFEQNNKSIIPIDFNEEEYLINSRFSKHYDRYLDYKKIYCNKLSSKVEIINCNTNFFSFVYTELVNRHDIYWSNYIYSKSSKQEFYNYLYINNQVQKVTLQDIFKTNSKYTDTLNFYLKKYGRDYNLKEELEYNDDLKVEDINTMMSNVKDSYIIDKDKIIFYLSAQNVTNLYVRNSKKYITLEVSFDELKNVLNYNGVLKYIK